MAEKKQGCIISLLKWMNFLLIIITGISFAAPYFSPSTFWPFIFLGMGFPILIMLNIFCILFWLYIKKWYFIFSLMCVVMSWSGGGKFIGNPFKSSEIKDGKSISIMTYNARGGGLNINKTFQPFTDLVLKKDCDIICFQELNIGNKKYKKIHYFS